MGERFKLSKIEMAFSTRNCRRTDIQQRGLHPGWFQRPPSTPSIRAFLVCRSMTCFILSTPSLTSVGGRARVQMFYTKLSLGDLNHKDQGGIRRMITCAGIAGLSNCQVPSRLRSPILDKKPETTQKGGLKDEIRKNHGQAGGGATLGRDDLVPCSGLDPDVQMIWASPTHIQAEGLSWNCKMGRKKSGSVDTKRKAAHLWAAQVSSGVPAYLALTAFFFAGAAFFC